MKTERMANLILSLQPMNYSLGSSLCAQGTFFNALWECITDGSLPSVLGSPLGIYFAAIPQERAILWPTHVLTKEVSSSACNSSRVVTMEATALSTSPGLWYCSSLLDTCSLSENICKIPQKQQRLRDCKKVTEELVLYLKPNATASHMDGGIPSRTRSQGTDGAEACWSHQPPLVHKTLLFPWCFSKSNFKSSVEN